MWEQQVVGIPFMVSHDVPDDKSVFASYRCALLWRGLSGVAPKKVQCVPKHVPMWVAAIVQSFGNAKRSKDESKEGPAFKIDPKDSDIKDLPSTNSTPSPWSHNGIVNSKSFCFKQDSLKSISSLGSSSLMPCQKDFTRLGLNMSSKSSWLPKKDWITVTGSKNEKPASSLQDFLGFQHGDGNSFGQGKSTFAFFGYHSFQISADIVCVPSPSTCSC